MKKIDLIRSHLRKYKKDFFLYYLFAFLSWIISFILPYLSGMYVDILLAAEKDLVIWFTFTVFFLNTTNLYFKYKSELARGKVNTNIGYQISFSLYEKLKKVNLSYYHNLDTVYLVNRINSDSNDIISFFTSNILSFITQLLTMILGVLLLAYINLPIAIVTIVVIPFYILIYNIFKKKLYDVNYNFFEQRSEYFSKMTEQLSFIKFIKTHSLYEWFSKRLEKAYNNLFIAFLKYAKTNYIFSNASSLILVLVNTFIIFYGGMSVVNKKMTIGSFSIITVYVNLIVSSINYFLNLGAQYQEFQVSNNRLLELFELPVEENGSAILKKIDCISLRNVSFAYDKKEGIKKLINNINMEFRTGNTYALVGKNGSGKSTFISLILGLYADEDLFQGNILYNNNNIKLLNMYMVRKNCIAVTEQEPILLNSSISENIFMGNKYNVEKTRYQEYCKKFNIEYLISNDFNKVNIDQKPNLSGGEKQKVCIIRSLLKDASVIIFDEPTSALDKESIEKLTEIINEIKIDKIIIIITHDQDISKICDYSYVFN